MIVPTRAASVLERLIAVMVKSEQRVICISGSCDGEIFLEINGSISYKGRCNVLARNVHIMRLLGYDVSDMPLEMLVIKDDIQYVDKLFSKFNVSDTAVKEKKYLFKFLRPKKSLPGCENGCLETEPHCILQITAEDVIDEIEKMV